MLDEKYYQRMFESVPVLIASDPYPIDDMKSWRISGQVARQLEVTGSELLCVASKTRDLTRSATAGHRKD
jgi:hypothetical protein